MSSKAREALDQARLAIQIVAQKPLTKIEQYRLVSDNARLKTQLETERACRLANEAELHRADERIGALSRIIRRTLACGQLEKLEDARPHLAAPTTSGGQ